MPGKFWAAAAQAGPSVSSANPASPRMLQGQGGLSGAEEVLAKEGATPMLRMQLRDGGDGALAG